MNIEIKCIKYMVVLYFNISVLVGMNNLSKKSLLNNDGKKINMLMLGYIH
jgi:hypothetical protein